MERLTMKPSAMLAIVPTTASTLIGGLGLPAQSHVATGLALGPVASTLTASSGVRLAVVHSRTSEAVPQMPALWIACGVSGQSGAPAHRVAVEAAHSVKERS